MARSYHARCRDRLERLRRRVAFLSARIEAQPLVNCVHDQQERSALLWAIEELERWETVAEVLDSDQSDAEKVRVLRGLLRSRLCPSDADLARTPGLAKQWRAGGAGKAKQSGDQEG